MSIFSKIKATYHTKKQQYLNKEEIMKNEVKAGFDVLSQADKGFNYNKWYIVIFILFFIAGLFIGQSPYSDYSHAYVQISEILLLFAFLMPMFLILRLYRIIGKLQSQTINHKD